MRPTRHETSRGGPPRFAEALAGLQTSQKSSRGVSLYSTKVNRPAGRVVAAAAASRGLSPNALTIASGAFSLAAVVAVATAPPGALVGVLVALALVIGFVLDAADGQLARLQASGSPAGEWLDHVLDCVVKLTLHAAVLVAWYRSGVGTGWLVVPLVFQAVAVLFFFGGVLAGKLREQASMTTSRSRQSPATRLSWLLLLPVDHGVICLSFALWGWQDGFRLCYAALLAAHALFLLVFAYRWYRELSR